MLQFVAVHALQGSAAGGDDTEVGTCWEPYHSKPYHSKRIKSSCIPSKCAEVRHTGRAHDVAACLHAGFCCAAVIVLLNAISGAAVVDALQGPAADGDSDKAPKGTCMKPDSSGRVKSSSQDSKHVKVRCEKNDTSIAQYVSA